MVRRLVIVTLGLALLATAGLVAAVRYSAAGYFSPQFTPDGSAVVVVVRHARAWVLGLGYDMVTPPARILVARDRFSVLKVTLADGRAETLHDAPASPLEGTWIKAYRPRIYGSAQAHLRWATPDALEYEFLVTLPRQPSSDTYVTRRRWDAVTRRLADSGAWARGFSGMGGNEASQLHGNREVVAVGVPGGAMPCAVVIVTTGEPAARPILESDDCRRAHPDGYAVSALADLIRRQDIERVAHLERTRDELVAAARARGLGENDAALEAIRGMQRLGLYPKPSTMVAMRVASAPAGATVFAISDMEFRVGIFNDIREALDRPGEEIEKSMGTYVIHDDFDTSRQINQRLADRTDTELFVQADAALWRIVVDFR